MEPKCLLRLSCRGLSTLFQLRNDHASFRGSNFVFLYTPMTPRTAPRFPIRHSECHACHRCHACPPLYVVGMGCRTAHTRTHELNCEEAAGCQRHGKTPPRLQAMKVDKRQKKRSGGNSSEIGAIRVFAKPGPDAEDRLRRLLSLLVKYATQDGQATSGNASLTDDRHAGDPPEVEA